MGTEKIGGIRCFRRSIPSAISTVDSSKIDSASRICKDTLNSIPYHRNTTNQGTGRPVHTQRYNSQPSRRALD